MLNLLHRSLAVIVALSQEDGAMITQKIRLPNDATVQVLGCCCACLCTGVCPFSCRQT